MLRAARSTGHGRYMGLLIAMLAICTFSASLRASEIVALGASNTWGKGVSRSEAYPAHLQRMLWARGIKVRVRNAGINGNTTGQMLARLGSAIRSGTRLVILQPGGNDRRRGVPRAVRQDNIRAIKRRLKARGIRIVMLRNSLIRLVAQKHPRPDGQHFKSAGYRALAAQLLRRVLANLGRR